jgi:hypothetical protein
VPIKGFYRLEILKKNSTYLQTYIFVQNFDLFELDSEYYKKKLIYLPGHDRGLQKCKIFCPDLQICLISIGLHRGPDQVCSFFQFHVSDFALAVLHKIFRQPNLIFLDHEVFHVAMHLY